MSVTASGPAHPLEEQVLLRVPPEVAEQIRAMIKSKKPNKKIAITMDDTNQPRTGKLTIDYGLNLSAPAATTIPVAGGAAGPIASSSSSAGGGPVQSGVVDYRISLVDLPTIVELYKTFDATGYYKTGDIHQMFIADPATPHANASHAANAKLPFHAKTTPAAAAAAAAVGGLPLPGGATASSATATTAAANVVRAPTHPIQYPSGITPPTQQIGPKLYHKHPTPAPTEVAEVEALLDRLWKGDKIEEFKVVEIEEEVEVEVTDAELEEERMNAAGAGSGTPGRSPSINAGGSGTGTGGRPPSSVGGMQAPSSSPYRINVPAGGTTPSRPRGTDDDDALRTVAGVQSTTTSSRAATLPLPGGMTTTATVRQPSPQIAAGSMPPPAIPQRFHTPQLQHQPRQPSPQLHMQPQRAALPLPLPGGGALPLPTAPQPLQPATNFPPRPTTFQLLPQSQQMQYQQQQIQQQQQQQMMLQQQQQQLQQQHSLPVPPLPASSMAAMSDTTSLPLPTANPSLPPPAATPAIATPLTATSMSSGGSAATTPVAATPPAAAAAAAAAPAAVASPAVLALRAEIAGLDRAITEEQIRRARMMEEILRRARERAAKAASALANAPPAAPSAPGAPPAPDAPPDVSQPPPPQPPAAASGGDEKKRRPNAPTRMPRPRQMRRVPDPADESTRLIASLDAANTALVQLCTAWETAPDVLDAALENLTRMRGRAREFGVMTPNRARMMKGGSMHLRSDITEWTVWSWYEYFTLQSPFYTAATARAAAVGLAAAPPKPAAAAAAASEPESPAVVAPVVDASAAGVPEAPVAPEAPAAPDLSAPSFHSFVLNGGGVRLPVEPLSHELHASLHSGLRALCAFINHESHVANRSVHDPSPHGTKGKWNATRQLLEIACSADIGTGALLVDAMIRCALITPETVLHRLALVDRYRSSAPPAAVLDMLLKPPYQLPIDSLMPSLSGSGVERDVKSEYGLSATSVAAAGVALGTQTALQLTAPAAPPAPADLPNDPAPRAPLAPPNATIPVSLRTLTDDGDDLRAHPYTFAQRLSVHCDSHASEDGQVLCVLMKYAIRAGADIDTPFDNHREIEAWQRVCAAGPKPATNAAARRQQTLTDLTRSIAQSVRTAVSMEAANDEDWSDAPTPPPHPSAAGTGAVQPPPPPQPQPRPPAPVPISTARPANVPAPIAAAAAPVAAPVVWTPPPRPPARSIREIWMADGAAAARWIKDGELLRSEIVFPVTRPILIELCGIPLVLIDTIIHAYLFPIIVPGLIASAAISTDVSRVAQHLVSVMRAPASGPPRGPMSMSMSRNMTSARSSSSGGIDMSNAGPMPNRNRIVIAPMSNDYEPNDDWAQ